MVFAIEDFKDEDVVLVYVKLFDGTSKEVPGQGSIVKDAKDSSAFAAVLKTIDVDLDDVSSWRIENFRGHGVLYARDEPGGPFLEKDW